MTVIPYTAVAVFWLLVIAAFYYPEMFIVFLAGIAVVMVSFALFVAVYDAVGRQ